MKCPKCGREMPDGLRFCGECSKRIDRPGARGKKILPILLGVLAVCLVITAVALFLPGNTSGEQQPGGVSDGCYTPRSENIVFEDETQASGYVNNMVLIFFSPDATEQQISSAVAAAGGTVVGKIAGLNQYQVEVDAADRAQLEDLCAGLEQLEGVVFAIVDNVVSVTTDSMDPPNDPWKDTFQGFWGVDWNEEKPGGSNWWLEATRVLSAWEHEDAFSTIRVGVVDNGFDTAHEDLSIQVLNSDVNNPEDHGTHVAGIIGATVNNGVGISGILKNVELYGVDCYQTADQEKNHVAVSSLYDGIVTCLQNGCKVVNMSSGLHYDDFDSEEAVREAAGNTADDSARYLLYMHLTFEEDFIILESAGNGKEGTTGVDSAEFHGFFSSINEELLRSILSQHMESLTKDGSELDEDALVQQCLDSVMIVASVDKDLKNGQYQLAPDSNYGDAITVCAPGVDVFSTLVSGGFNGSYGYLSGTSMATPVAAGITAMVWSVDPEMTAGEVKNIVISTAITPVLSRQKADTGTYFLIDAEAAVERAIYLADLPERLTIAPECTLHVYNEANALASNYTVTVSLLDMENIPQGPGASPVKKSTETYHVTTPEPFRLSLSAGLYEIVITDGTDSANAYSFYALVAPEGEAEHSVYTSIPAQADEEEPREPVVPSKQLTLVQQYENGTLACEEVFTYSDNGLLVGYTTRYFNRGTTDYDTSVSLTYDTEGRLIRFSVLTPDGYSAGENTYTYNDQGQLVQSSTQGGASSVTTYEYDEQGRLIRSTEDWYGHASVTEYFYNDQGLLFEAIETDPSGSATLHSYTYDDQGRLSGEMVDRIYATYTYTHLYSYPPFAITVTEESSGHSHQVISLTDKMGHTLWSISAVAPSYMLDQDGCIETILDPDYDQEFRFYYDGALPEAPVESEPTQPAEEPTEAPATEPPAPAADYQSFLAGKHYLSDWEDAGLYEAPESYTLIDLDQNGNQELILLSASDMGFYSFLVYGMDSGEILRLDIPVEGYSICTCYGQPQYSAEYRALTFSEVRPTLMLGGWGYYALNGQQLTAIGGVSWEGSSGTTVYSASFGGSTETISEEEKNAYLSELQPLEYLPLP